MNIKLKIFALPLGLLTLCLGTAASRAATPITTFGVTATVLTGCKVSGATVNASYAAALEHAASSVSVSCTDNTQYSIAVIADPSVNSSVALGKFSFPVQSLMNYAMSSVPVHSNGLGGNAARPQVAYGESQSTSDVAVNTPPHTIFVAITY